MSKKDMIKAIVETAKAASADLTGDDLFRLAFKSEDELKNICKNLRINNV